MLSATDIEIYRACPLRYKFARVYSRAQGADAPAALRDPDAPGARALPHPARQPGGADRRRSDARAHPGHAHVAVRDRLATAGFGELERGARSCASKAVASLERYHQRFAGEQASPVWFERNFSFRIGPHLLRGRVDRVDRHPDGSYELIDYKTGRARTPSQLKDDIQLSLYQIGAKRVVEARVLTPELLLPAGRREGAAPADRGGRHSHPGHGHRGRDGILAQEFEPTPSYSACSTCDFQLICPAAERYHQPSSPRTTAPARRRGRGRAGPHAVSSPDRRCRRAP